MAMKEQAKIGLKKLLQLLPQEEVLAVAQTVTNRQLHLQSYNEALNAIILYSQSIDELLKRQKIRKKILFQYLANENIAVDPNAEKGVLVRKIVEYLDANEAKNHDNLPEQNASNSREPQDISNHSKHNVPGNQGQISSISQEEEEMFEFAKQFSEWFYQMLNNCNPSIANSDRNNQLTSVHFYLDCKMKLLSKTANSRVDELSGQDLVFKRLQAFALEELLLFNPNLERKGLKGEKSAHGLIVIHVCGTIHRGPEALGIFEQRFGLIKDPSGDNNWKIKYTNLALTAGGVQTKPILGQFGDNANMLTES